MNLVLGMYLNVRSCLRVGEGLLLGPTFSVVLFDTPGISISHAAHRICRVLVFASFLLFNLIYLLTVKIR